MLLLGQRNISSRIVLFKCLQRRINLLPNNALVVHNARYKHQVSYKPYVPPCPADHDHKNMALKRPMSPHLTIYEPTLPAITSVAQRGTGAILTFYALMLSAGTLVLSNGVETYVSIIQSLNLSFLSVFVIKFLLGIPFVYHYLNGIRYCAWNLGKWLDMKDVYGSAKKSFILAPLIAAFFAML